MRNVLLVLLAWPLLVTPSLAGQPASLNDRQLDAVSAGTVFLFSLSETDINNSGTIMVNIDPVPCGGCFLNIRNEAFTLQAQFGPIAGSNSFVFLSHGF